MKKMSIGVTEAARKVCTGRELAEALAKTNLPESEAKVWRRVLKIARKKLQDASNGVTTRRCRAEVPALH